jgi:hypothetical protein
MKVIPDLLTMSIPHEGYSYLMKVIPDLLNEHTHEVCSFKRSGITFIRYE